MVTVHIDLQERGLDPICSSDQTIVPIPFRQQLFVVGEGTPVAFTYDQIANLAPPLQARFILGVRIFVRCVAEDVWRLML